jgi:hypothetical protein
MFCRINLQKWHFAMTSSRKNGHFSVSSSRKLTFQPYQFPKVDFSPFTATENKNEFAYFSNLFLILIYCFHLKWLWEKSWCLGTVSITLHFLRNLCMGPISWSINKLGQKFLPVTNTLAYWVNSYVTKKMKCCEYGPRW